MDGKRVFVTGGAKGIGAAIVTAFCNVGARVAFCDTDEKAASRLYDLLPTFVQGKQRYGRIINIASTRYLQSEPGSECYAASKGGIVSLTHALALSFSDYNITVNSISPGWIQNEDYRLLKRSDHNQHPSGRVGRPSDIASACLFLAAPENDFINGQNIVIDGGMTKKMIYE